MKDFRMLVLDEVLVLAPSMLVGVLPRQASWRVYSGRLFLARLQVKINGLYVSMSSGSSLCN